MNKIYNINLGGYPFTIDDDAYQQLNQYLKTIHKHFQDAEGRDEIISDIEARIAELFNESSEGRQIVTIQDVERAIQIMGTPEEFGAEGMDESQEKKSKYRTGKRLFRDGENKIIGGVCSGVASYFGIDDPIWVRIGFVISFFAGGVAVPLYLILWAIMPEAKTAGDRLSMRGEDINVSSIARQVQDEIDNLSDTLSEIGRGFGSKKKAWTKTVKQDAPLRRGFIH